MREKLCMKSLFMGVHLLLCMALYTTTQAGEWNEKPIMCANEVETFEAIGDKKEEFVFKAIQLTKVRTDTGLAKNPVAVALDMYVNAETGTFTILEFHPTYESYCVISHGVNFQVFLGGVQ